MFTSIQQGLEIYKQALRAYIAWLDPLKKQMDKVHGRGRWSPLGHFGTTDYERITRESAELAAMERALGLTKEEIASIGKECGLKQFGPRKRKAA